MPWVTDVLRDNVPAVGPQGVPLSGLRELGEDVGVNFCGHQESVCGTRSLGWRGEREEW